jgi:hypothetical protein
MNKTSAGMGCVGDTRGSGRRKVDARFGSTFMRTRMQGCGVSEERSYLCGGAWDDEKVKNQKMSSIGFYQWV